jgi:hypothetical protein
VGHTRVGSVGRRGHRGASWGTHACAHGVGTHTTTTTTRSLHEREPRRRRKHTRRAPHLVHAHARMHAQEESDYLMELCDRFDLKFVVVQDRYDVRRRGYILYMYPCGLVQWLPNACVNGAWVDGVRSATMRSPPLDTLTSLSVSRSLSLSLSHSLTQITLSAYRMCAVVPAVAQCVCTRAWAGGDPPHPNIHRTPSKPTVPRGQPKCGGPQRALLRDRAAAACVARGRGVCGRQPHADAVPIQQGARVGAQGSGAPAAHTHGGAGVRVRVHTCVRACVRACVHSRASMCVVVVVVVVLLTVGPWRSENARRPLFCPCPY